MDRRLSFTWLSCTIKISNKCQIFWVHHKMLKVRTGQWDWRIHCDTSLSKVPADFPEQLFNFHRYIIQYVKTKIQGLTKEEMQVSGNFQYALKLCCPSQKGTRGQEHEHGGRKAKSILIKAANTTINSQRDNKKLLYCEWEESLQLKLCDTEVEMVWYWG